MRVRLETERVDLFDVNIVITMNVRLNADVHFDAMEYAFEMACSKREVLQSKIVIEPDGEAYYVDNEVPRNFFTKTSLSLTELINENEKKRFHIEEGEYIRGFDSPDGVVFMMHHLGGDGKSLLYFIETFMRCLNGENVEAVPFVNLTYENIPIKNKLPLFYESVIKLWNKKWNKERKVFDFDDMDKAYSKYWNNHQSFVQINRYEKNELSKLLEQSKTAGVSLTSYLITDLIKDTPAKMDVGIAVDGRLNSNRSLGNQVTGISIKYRYDQKKSFEANAKCVHNLIRKRISNNTIRYFVLRFMGKIDLTLRDALNLERTGYYSTSLTTQVADNLGYGKKCRDLSITNLTRADIPLTYGNHEIKEIIFVPPVVSYARNVIGIITTGDTMYITRHV